jgi:hypothetical protein
MITKDNLTLDNARSLVTAYTNIAADKLGVPILKDFQNMQILLRRKLCQSCFENKRCHGCTCKVPGLFYDPYRIDHDKKWGPMMTKNEWDNFLATINIKLKEEENDEQTIKKLTTEYHQYYVKFFKEEQAKKNKGQIKMHVLNIPEDNCFYDYGTIKLNSDGEHVFSFVNTLPVNLSIVGMISSCGCTTPDYKSKVVKPGEEYSFKVSYDTKRLGVFNKNITINVAEKNILIPNFTIKGNVVK